MSPADYTAVSRRLIDAVGGKDNIESSGCCITRLRLILRDEALADDDAVLRIDGVRGVFKRGGQYQIVVGFGVDRLLDVFDAVRESL